MKTKEHDQPPGAPAREEAAERRRRLAEALRDNLRRRKLQERQRLGKAGEPPASDDRA